MNLLRTAIISTLLTVFTFSNEHTLADETSYIDETHKTLSDTILTWSDTLDTKISGWFSEEDVNGTAKVDQRSDRHPVKKRVQYVDSFFQNKKYVDEAEETYVTLRLDTEFKSRESTDFRAKVSGQVALSKSKQQFKFFVDNATSDNIENILEEDASSSPEFGFHYFAPEKYGVDSRYSLGLRGIHPFARARYYMVFDTEKWFIEPSQTFRYSSNNKFEEDTNIYFDRHFEDLSLFRLVMHRGTQETKKGMDYDLTLQYYWSPMDNVGLRVSQSFVGNTKYTYIDTTADVQETKRYGGVYDYISSFSYRQNIWRKWFFYEVRPGVSFHKIHDFEPNYTLRVFFDFHFGKYQ